jgi:benzoylformate decarboxylase/acetolactate synthase-1/2/3 large subunit
MYGPGDRLEGGVVRYGSDVIVEWLVQLGIRHVALNPGATIRGLHESLVREPRLTTVLALHEETAVGIAHGFWKATGEPMAVFLHDLVGIQHASMALFNATVDRAAMLVLGGSGPADERGRRPWLDWIHYSTRHDSAVHDVVKATGQPSSLLGVRDGLIRGMRTALSTPAGPVFLGIDTALQEGVADPAVSWPAEVSLTGTAASASADEIARVADLLASAQFPVVVVDRPVRGGAEALVGIAEMLGAAVVDLGGGFSFPTDHWAYQTESRRDVLARADVVLVVEARDPVWALAEVDTGSRQTTWLTAQDPVVVTVGTAPLLAIPGVEVEQLMSTAVPLVAEAGPFLRALATKLTDAAAADRTRIDRLTVAHDSARAASRAALAAAPRDAPVHPARLVDAVGRALTGRDWLLANGIVQNWPARLLDIGPGHPFLGRSAGEGLGYGLPASLGAALAHRDDGVVVVNLQSDGDLMYTASALWTAAHHRLPLLTVMYDNGTYGKDELHQRELAALRDRPQNTTHIGIRLDDPRIDFAALAAAQGVRALGPIDDPNDLDAALAAAVHVVAEQRRPALVHVRCR